MLLAIYDDEIAGILTLTGKSGIKLSHRAILGLSVKKRYWGIGIGHSLMTSSVECSLNSPIFKIELEVVTTNTRAINLYKKFGFSIDGIIKYAKIHRNKIYDHYIMSRLVKEIQ
jgi:RimJ/RimL family protein N-acetyltransferase